MTIAVHLATVANSIANLNVSGVRICDIDEIPQSADKLCPLLIPQPNDYVTDIMPTFQSFGSNGGAAIDLDYNLHYIYLHSPAGSGVAPFEMYAGLIRNLTRIIEAILGNDAVDGLVDLQLGGIGNIGIVADPANNEYWGITFVLKVKEFAQ